MTDSAVPSSTTRRPFPRRLHLLLLVGLLLIGGSLLLRNSRWGREQRLRALSVEELALAIHDRPRDPLVFLHYGAALLGAGKLQEAEAALRRAVELAPRDKATHLALGGLLLRAGDPYRAVQSFERATQLAPRDVSAWLGLAQAYYHMGSPKRALPALEKIVRIEPRRSIAWYYLGKLYGEAHQSDKALEAIRRAVALDPNRAEYWRDLGQLQRYYSRLDEAEASLLRALKLAPGDYLAHYWLGQLYGRRGRSHEQQAETHLKEALRLEPRIAEGYFELGQVYERRGDWARAAEQYRKARDLDPSLSRPLYGLGLCLIKLGRESEGRRLIEGFEKLTAAKQEIEGIENRLRADPQNRELTLRMARVYRKYGNDHDALALYERYLQLMPTDEAVRREVDGYRRTLGAAPAPSPRAAGRPVAAP